MEIKTLEIDGKIYYYVNEYTFEFGTFHKFATIDEEVVFTIKEDEKYEVVTGKRILKKLQKEFNEIKIKDIV